MRWNKDFRINPCDLNMRSIRYLDRQRTGGGAEGITVVLSAFVALANRVDNSEEANALTPRAHCFDNNEVVKLDLIFPLYSNPKLQRRRIFRTKDETFNAEV